MNPTSYELTPVGWVESPLTDPDQAPKQGIEGSPDAWLVFAPALTEAAADIRAGDELIVLTWLDRARRDVLRVHPRDDSRTPSRVFQDPLRRPPNPIGLHPVEVIAVEGNRIRVRNLEALDGTPIIDVKPVLSATRT